MRERLFVMLVLLTFAGFSAQETSAQLPGGLKIPRIGRPKTTPTPTPAPAEPAQTAPSSESPSTPSPQTNTPKLAASAPASQDAAGETTIIKTRIQFRPQTLTSYQGNYNDVWSWVPGLNFNTTGPGLPSGARYYAEVAQPGGAAWLKIKCDTAMAEGSYECKADSDQEKSGTLATGVFPFAIKVRNPLEGTEKTLFTGRAKVEKVLTSGNIPPTSKQFVYYANHDWNLPIGHAYLDNQNFLNIRFWIRGEAANNFNAHLFYRGEEVGLFEKYGNQYGAARCSSDIEYQPTRDAGAAAPQGAKWQRLNCTFQTVIAKLNNDIREWDGHVLGAHPGDYEIKVLRGGRLARSLKLSIGPDGNIVDNGIAASNGLGGANFIIVPVTVIGDYDGPWDRNTWKTDAFYGNPLKGFNWPSQ